jgi:hypothetical protein
MKNDVKNSSNPDFYQTQVFIGSFSHSKKIPKSSIKMAPDSKILNAGMHSGGMMALFGKWKKMTTQYPSIL